jgi:Mg2+ and Co2+ transporter CorA
MATKEIYQRQEDASVVLIETIEVETTSIEDQIKSKEEQLLEIYNEIQQLKEQQ